MYCFPVATPPVAAVGEEYCQLWGSFDSEEHLPCSLWHEASGKWCKEKPVRLQNATFRNKQSKGFPSVLCYQCDNTNHFCTLHHFSPPCPPQLNRQGAAEKLLLITYEHLAQLTSCMVAPLAPAPHINNKINFLKTTWNKLQVNVFEIISLF